MLRKFCGFIILFCISSITSQSPRLLLLDFKSTDDTAAVDFIEGIFNRIVALNDDLKETVQRVNFFDDSHNLAKTDRDVSRYLDMIYNETTQLESITDSKIGLNIDFAPPKLIKVDKFFRSTNFLMVLMKKIHDRFGKTKSILNRINNRYESIDRGTLRKFSAEAFSSLEGSDITLEIIYNTFIKPLDTSEEISFVKMYEDYTKTQAYTSRCGIGVSAQTQFYYIYSSVLEAEIKEMENFFLSYMFSTLLRQVNFRIGMTDAKNKSLRRIKQYREAATKILKTLPTDIRKCDAEKLIRGETFAELEGYIQLHLYDQYGFKKGCVGDCPWKYTDNTWHDTIYYCTAIGGTVERCESEKGSTRSYEWYRTGTTTYGQGQGKCEKITRHDYYLPEVIDTKGPWGTAYSVTACHLCQCVRYASYKIQVAPLMSNMENNMVITGVKFSRDNGILRLKIKEGKLSKLGNIADSNEYLPPSTADIITVDPSNPKYYLDDVKLPLGWVVTGVKLIRDNGNFGLSVGGVPYNFMTGELDKSQFRWFSYGEGERPQVNLSDEADSPLKCQQFQHLEISKSFAWIGHSSALGDAGQTTTPIFDTQSIDMSMAFPLNGIGFFFKKCKNHSGMISIRLYTVDVTNP